VINIITLEREYGCGAAGIAKALTARLGWALWDHEITCEIARRLKCDVKSVEEREEKPDPAYYGLVKVFMRGSYEDAYSGGGIELLDAERLSGLFEKIIKDVAARGPCVIVGRGAPWFLRKRSDTMCIFLFAPYHEKLRRTLAQGKGRQEADDLLERVDRDRAAFVKKYYGLTWPYREIYDVMINTIHGDDAVIDMILKCRDRLNSRTA
jgi:cytidylate kinase